MFPGGETKARTGGAVCRFDLQQCVALNTQERNSVGVGSPAVGASLGPFSNSNTGFEGLFHRWH